MASVLITGGARGIGKGIANAFLQAGHHVMIADLSGARNWNYDLATEDVMAETVAELKDFGDVRSVGLDVTDAASCDKAVVATIDAFGGIDILCNNAGVIASGPIEDMAEDDWDRVFDVNVKGIYNMTRSALSQMTLPHFVPLTAPPLSIQHPSPAREALRICPPTLLPNSPSSD